MRTKKPALILYFVACIAAIIAAYLESDTLLLLTKPVVIPAIFFYYLSARKTQRSKLVVFFLALNFIGDTIVLLDLQDPMLILMVPYFLSYLILLYMAIKDIRKVSFDRFGAGIGIFVFLLLLTLIPVLVQSFSYEQQSLAIPIVTYGVILAIYVGLAAYHFYSTASTIGFYMIMSALFCVVSDVFYVMFSMILLFPGLLFFDLGLQLFSYFFIVKYFVLRKD
ncbi:MAG TPA: lysoplasmalogenase family protein [Flavobacterium sp.]|jgi:hypothetical protein